VERCNARFDKSVSATLESLSEALLQNTNSNYSNYGASNPSGDTQSQNPAAISDNKTSVGQKRGSLFVSENERRKRILNGLEEKHLSNVMSSLDKQSDKSIRVLKRQEAILFDQVALFFFPLSLPLLC
jgi:hypothetical protein